jgi:hypothetical protein
MAPNRERRIVGARSAYDPPGGGAVDAEHACHLPSRPGREIGSQSHLSDHGLYSDEDPRVRFVEDIRRLEVDAMPAPAFRP